MSVTKPMVRVLSVVAMAGLVAAFYSFGTAGDEAPSDASATPIDNHEAEAPMDGGEDAGIEEMVVEYSDGDTVLEGFAAMPADMDENTPGVLIIHQWTGLTDYEKRRARMLAEMGYVAFALDIFGKGVRPSPGEEASGVTAQYYEDRELFRRRANFGLDQLREVTDGKLAAIGYCFGGTGVLELARSGADIAGVVSFHGGLGLLGDETDINASVMVCHGADDPYVPQEQVQAFIEAMKSAEDEAGVDWQLIQYSGAVHSFTQPMAGDDPSRGAAYNETADMRSWSHMTGFFDELFAD